MLRKSIDFMFYLFWALYICSLILFWYFDDSQPMVRAWADRGIRFFSLVLIICLACKLFFALRDRYYLATYDYVHVEEGFHDGYATATLRDGGNKTLFLADPKKEVLDAKVQQIRRNPWGNGFTVPLGRDKIDEVNPTEQREEGNDADSSADTGV